MPVHPLLATLGASHILDLTLSLPCIHILLTSKCIRHFQSPTMLSVKRPTPTTVLYTVSTRSLTTTLAARASAYGLLLARILAGICVAVILLYEYRLATPSVDSRHGFLPNLEHTLFTSPLGQIAALTAAHSNRIWRLLTCSGAVWLTLKKGYTSESLLVIRGLGVQTSTSSPSYLWTSSTRFIPTSSIQDIFIHEAFKGFEVRFYLAIVVEGEGEVVVVFPVGLHLKRN